MFKKKTLILLSVLLIFSVFALPVSADAYNNGGTWFINMPISQPNCTDEFAYIEVFTHSTEQGFGVDTYLIHAVKDLSATIQTSNPTLVTTVNGRELTFTTGASSYYVDIFCINSVGTLWNIGTTQGNGTISTLYSAPANIACVKYYGFAVNDASTVVNNITNISAVYGNDINSIQYLYEILLAIQSQSNSDVVGAINSASQNEQNNANAIQSNADKNASDIQQNQNDNTDKQIQADKDLYDKEHSEIESSGDSAVDGADNIPDKSEGFISSLTNFVSAMSTTDTSCSITFPAITTPAIAGIPSYTLSEEQDVDFSEAIALLPTSIMTLVQSLLTIGLIIFAFKELYDTISEALTRRKMSDE